MAPAALSQRLSQSAGALAPLGGIVLLLLLAAVTTPGFFSADVMRLVLFQIALIGITALGQTLVLLVGGIDLSMAGVMALATVIIADFTQGQDALLWLGVLLALGAGMVVGAANAALVLLRNVPPFVTTFAMLVLVQGIVIAWTRGAPAGGTPAALSTLGRGEVLGVPVATLVFAALALVIGVVLVRTTLGRRIYASGLNRRAANLSGVPTGWVMAGCYVTASVTAVVAGLVNAGYIGYVDAALLRGLDLNSIAAAVIGGIVLGGGRGRIEQTVLGVVLLATLLTWLIQLGAGAAAQQIVSGSVILLAVLLQSLKPRLRTTDARPALSTEGTS